MEMPVSSLAESRRDLRQIVFTLVHHPHRAKPCRTLEQGMNVVISKFKIMACQRRNLEFTCAQTDSQVAPEIELET
jgi:hypothetical protein